MTIVDPVKSAGIREEGNKMFKLGNYRRSIELYTAAISWSPEDPKPITNRASAFINLGLFHEALEVSRSLWNC
jgi:tetratricopeptide (TPR) repeat protein